MTAAANWIFCCMPFDCSRVSDSARALAGTQRLEQPRVDRVQSAERLVEHDQLRLVNDRGRELDLLLHALRQLARERLGARAQADALEPSTGAAIGFGEAEAADRR